MRPLLCALGIAFIAFVSYCSSAGADEFVPLRIVTFNSEFLAAPSVNQANIEHFHSYYGRTQHLERVAHLVETLNPDVLNLVEVTSKEAVDALVKILHEKGLTDYRGYHVECNDT